jgi:hypothetical protein
VPKLASIDHSTLATGVAASIDARSREEIQLSMAREDFRRANPEVSGPPLAARAMLVDRE